MAQGLSPETILFYTKKLKYFISYCDNHALTQVSQLTADLIRRYVIELRETHNQRGVHALFGSFARICLQSVIIKMDGNSAIRV